MPTQVRFRFNKLTGEVEEFYVDDLDRSLSEAHHDEVAVDIGRVIARRPTVVEAHPPASPPAREEAERPDTLPPDRLPPEDGETNR